MKYLVLSVATLALVACGQNAEHGHSDVEHSKKDHAKMDHSGANHNVKSHMTSSGDETTGIQISSAYVTPPFPGRDIAGGFFNITNYGEDDRLVSATSSISDAVEIHTHSEENGVMKMRQIEGVDLAQGETIKFKPGSYHLMMFGATIPEGTETVTVTLNYEKAAPMTLQVPLGERKKRGPKKGDMDHSKMDHSKMGHGKKKHEMAEE